MYDVGEQNGRKRNQKKKSGYTSKKGAAKALVEIESKINKGIYVEPSRELFSTYLLDWLGAKGVAIKEQTRMNYETIIRARIIPSLGNLMVSKLTARALQRFINELLEEGLSESYVVKVYNILNSSLKTAYKWKLLPENPMEFTDKPRIGRQEQSVWNEKELAEFLRVARSDRLYAAFFLAMTTGLRRGEILGLRWRDVDVENKVLFVSQILSPDGKKLLSETKTTSSRRSVDLCVETVGMLRKQRRSIVAEKVEMGEGYQDHDLVICTVKGTPVSPRNVVRSFKRLSNKAGLNEIRFHDLRHSHATLLVEHGADIKMVAERLGHSTTRMTLDTYTHVRKGRQKEAANLISKVLFENIHPTEINVEIQNVTPLLLASLK
ncbi:site-specific integrase [Paenibacillus agricola]|uniref:Site-specific integrase n=1 Tax=Paenibacillus agricola TaxID=2716264 RepID=A0ABX0IXX0_9BACL|nr:site-specific integrase [Paenibacillus agricola]NHN28538.1 site-specific integrase [Paenibacillus agricola]